ncbi:MBL fold metallo-hydrolase [Mycolicibacterium sp.]|uniref:MBL fold metallo-hydrolase n=1 Tax=Mycolicibacterium sp. TaxID=2320850 RepID=UPI003D09A633
MNHRWERLTPWVWRTRLPFCDVTIGLVHDGDEVLLIDTGTTVAEADAVAADVAVLTGRTVDHVLLTHNHFDHVLGYSVFAGARTYCAPAVVATMAARGPWLRDDAVRHGADPAAVGQAVARLSAPVDAVADTVLDLGATRVTIAHPGLGHTDHDLIAVVAGPRPVVFCGDLVEESGEPCFDESSDARAWPETLAAVLAAGGGSALYVPGHGAVVDAAFVRNQADWLAARA